MARILVAEPLVWEPLVWVDPKRLTIAPSAVVNNALFNLISSTITVERNVLFGHSVSLLTGTHDLSKLGRPGRRAPPSQRRTS